MRPIVLPLLACLALVLPGLAAASHDQGSGPRSLGGATLPRDVPLLVHVEAEAFDARPAGDAIADVDATNGTAWRLSTYSSISVHVDVPDAGIVWLKVRARGEHPDGLLTTHMHPVVDGAQRGEWDVGPAWTTYLQAMPLPKGGHAFAVEDFNNYHAAAIDRTLVVDWIEVSVPFLEDAPHVGIGKSALVDGPDIHEAGTGAARLDDPEARHRTSWQMWGIGCFVEQLVADEAGRYHVRARLRGNEPDGVGSRTTILVDGKRVLDTFAGANWTDAEVNVDLATGPRILDICYDNDYGGAQKRNLWLDELEVTPLKVVIAAPPPTPTPAPIPSPSTPPPSPSSPSSSSPSPQESRAAVPFPATAALVALALGAARLRRRS